MRHYVARRRPGQRSAHARCVRCKKVRKMWMRANEWWNVRISSMNVPGEGKVCWLCRIREVDPNWKPGMPIPEFPGMMKFKAATK
jgi:hypothetical protein